VSRVVAVIPARGGSRGIPRKNLTPVCGQPLIAWSIRQLLAASRVDEVYVSSNDAEILAAAEACGAGVIQRPDSLAGDTAPSEAAWRHALDVLDASGPPVTLMVGVQATSPIREPGDFDEAIALMERDELDSLLSCCELRDYFIWRMGENGAEGVNHDWRRRQRRQDIEQRYLENGSFYVFRPSLLRETDNRLGGRIGFYVMAKHKQFQIDDAGDITLCEAIMRGYGLDRLP
jgi:N-acylneuraminate cytidylyltransferase